MSDLVDETRRGITRRLEELQPFVEEYERLQAASSALAAIPAPGESASAAPRRRAAGRPRRTTRRTVKPQATRAAKATTRAKPRGGGALPGKRLAGSPKSISGRAALRHAGGWDRNGP